MASIREMVVADYQEKVAMADIPSELKRSLKAHERVPQFIDRLVDQIERIPIAMKRRRRPKPYKFDRMKIKMLVYDVTEIFIRGVMTEAENRYKSDIEKQMIKDAAAPQFQLDNEGNGVIEDMGVEVRDRDGTGE